jgi:putative oxidoreductase
MTHQESSKALHVTLWILQTLLSALMLMGAVMKFMPIEKLSAMMPWTGQVPPTMVRLLGIIDLLAGVGLILPSLLRIKPQLTVWAAWGIVALMVSAIIFHVSRGEASVTGINFIAAIAAGFIGWGRSENRLKKQ